MAGAGALLAGLLLAGLLASGPATADDPPRQYPFLCTTEANGLGQPLVDNQDGDGVPVFEEDEDGEPIRGEDHIVGWSRDCEAETRFDYYYVDTGGNRQHLWRSGEDPVSEKPEDVATTVTSEGDEVEFFLRRERGTVNRFIYSIAMLVPWEEVEAATPHKPMHESWNGKLVYSFDGGVAIGHSQGSVSSAASFLIADGSGHTRDIDALRRGYAVVFSTGNRTSTHYNLEVGAETALQTKAHFVEQHGEPEYTVGIGSSGGAIQQYVYGEHAPELIDAAIPVRGYPDMTTQTIHVGDCELLERYMDLDAPAVGDDTWADWDNRQWVQGMNSIESFVEEFPDSTGAQLAPLTGQTGSSECIEGWRGLSPLVLNPLFGSAPGLDRLDAEVVAEIEWTHWDDARNVYGTDPDTGFARVPWDNVGVQYGLEALQDGTITPDQFLHLNVHVGSWKDPEDMVQEGPPFIGDPTPEDFDPWSMRNMHLAPDEDTPAPRRAGDLAAIEAVYDSGLYFSGAIDIPVIDARQYLEAELDMHNSHQSFAARQRIDNALGHADHHVIWFFGDDRGADSQLPHALEVAGEWIENMQDGTDVVAAKPDAAVDTCFDNDGDIIAAGDGVWGGILDDGPDGECATVYPPYSQSRIVSGGPISGDVYKCRTMSVRSAVAEGLYGDWEPSAEEIAQLEEIFPEGVCDYGLPGAGTPGVVVPDAPNVRVDGTTIRVNQAPGGAEIELRRDGQVQETTTANRGGVAALTDVPAGTYTIRAVTDGHAGKLAEPVRVVVVRGSVEQIHVIGADPGAEVTVRGPRRFSAEATTDEHGGLVLRDVPPGNGYQVEVEGYGRERVEVLAPDDHPRQRFFDAQDLPADEGYLRTRDGTLLAYQVVLPDEDEFGPGPYPVVIDYSGYRPSIDFFDGVHRVFPAEGYAAVGVNIRGSACSGGAFDYFEPLQALDGYDMVEAIAAQDWSDGVALIGKSYPGISQLFVASTAPPSLDALAPGHVIGEFYRDVGYPGGLLNATFAGAFAVDQDARSAFPSSYDVVNERAEEDPLCRANQQLRGQNVRVAEGVFGNPFDGDFWQVRAPERLVGDIVAPTLLVNSWQDEQTGGGPAKLLDRFDPDTFVRMVGMNGDHGEYYRGAIWGEVVRFLDVYLGDAQDKQGDYEAEPSVQIFLENGLDTGQPGHVVELDDWGAAEDGQRWYLQPDGTLADAEPPAGGGTTAYDYEPEPNPLAQLMPDQNEWSEPPPDDETAIWVSDALDEDVVMAGSGSVDLWLASSETDTDVEVTLIEVRPDGQEMLVQSGWLRASHRALDEDRSTVLAPRHLHTEEAAEPLTAGELTPLRVELFPFAHAFRAGSQIKIAVEAPGGNRWRWGFDAVPDAGTNEIAHEAAAPSSVALPVIDVDVDLGELPECGTVSSQPCRPATVP